MTTLCCGVVSTTDVSDLHDSGSGSRDLRRRLLDEAFHLLAEQGPAALSARRLVKTVGASTMAVYTHFGSMPNLVRELIREGVQRFMDDITLIYRGEDPVAELAALCAVYHRFARTEPHVYAAPFGGSPLTGFEPTEQDREVGTVLLKAPHDAIRRCIDAGRFRVSDSKLLAWQLWCQMLGLAQLERTRYLGADAHTPEEVLAALLRDFSVGAGDAPETAAASVAAGLAAAAR
jgi:AcrR family transcriptional regulator